MVFDTVTENLKSVRAERVFYAPGENDVFLEGDKEYLGRFPGVNGQGRQSFDYKGVHFAGLVNGHIHQVLQKIEGNVTFNTPRCQPHSHSRRRAARRHRSRLRAQGGPSAHGLGPPVYLVQ